MNFIEQLLQQIPYLNSPIMIKLIKSVIIITILWLLKLVVNRLILRKITEMKSRYQWRKIISTAIDILGIIIVGRLWYEGVQSIATYLGLLSAGIAIALKDLIANFGGWI